MPTLTRRRLLLLAPVALALLYYFRRPVKAWVHAIYKDIMPKTYPATFPVRSQREHPAHARKVLFIGNSFTFYNQMPFLVEALTAKSNQPLAVAMLTLPLWNLSDHHKAGATQVIQSEKWDFVVLQEHSLGALEKSDRYRRDALSFIEVIKAAGAQPVLYQTWSDRNEPENQAAISHEINRLAKETDSILAPVGDLFHKLRAEKNPPDLHTLDGKHPTEIGSYAAAVTFFTALTKQSPVGLPTEIKLEKITYPAPLPFFEAHFQINPDVAKKIQSEIQKTLLAK